MLHNTFYRDLPEEVIQQVEHLHNSQAWKKANWTRKVKLAHKEFQRICHSKTHSTVSGPNKRKIVSLCLLSPLRIIPSGWYSSLCDPLNLLKFFNNKVGTRLTKIAIKKDGWIFMEDAISYRHDRFPLNFIEIRCCGMPLSVSYLKYPHLSNLKWMAHWIIRYEEEKMSPKSYDEMTNFVLSVKRLYINI